MSCVPDYHTLAIVYLNFGYVGGAEGWRASGCMYVCVCGQAYYVAGGVCVVRHIMLEGVCVWSGILW